MKWWESLPEWARWILLLPLVLVISFVINLIFALVVGTHLPNYNIARLIFSIFKAIAWFMVLQFAFFTFSPRFKVGIVRGIGALTILIGAIGIAAFAFNLKAGITTPGWESLSDLAQSITLALVAAASFFYKVDRSTVG